MYIGVTQAGYSVADEAPVFLVVFLLPAAIALGIWWKLRSCGPGKTDDMHAGRHYSFKEILSWTPTGNILM